jgi:urea transporter
VVGTVTPLLVTLGVLTNAVAAHVLAIAAAVLGLATNALAASNVAQSPVEDPEVAE